MNDGTPGDIAATDTPPKPQAPIVQLGDTVIYNPARIDAMLNGSDHHAAIVTRVVDADTVHLHVFGDMLANITLRQNIKRGTEPGSWSPRS